MASGIKYTHHIPFRYSMVTVHLPGGTALNYVALHRFVRHWARNQWAARGCPPSHGQGCQETIQTHADLGPSYNLCPQLYSQQLLCSCEVLFSLLFETVYCLVPSLQSLILLCCRIMSIMLLNQKTCNIPFRLFCTQLRSVMWFAALFIYRRFLCARICAQNIHTYIYMYIYTQ